MPGYNLGIGIGNALAQLPTGILQGEEIKRRRANEDDQREMARKEFENRQAMFGRTQKQWTQEDIAQDLYSKLQSNQITDEQFKQGMADAGLGEKLYGYTQQQAEAGMRKKSFEMQQESHGQQQQLGALNINEANRKRMNQDIVQGMLTLGTDANTNPQLLDNLAKAGADKGLIPPNSKISSARRTGKKNQEGIDTVEFTVTNSDGTASKPVVVDFESLGGALGIDDIRAVGTAQASRKLHRDQLALSARGMDDAKSAQLYETFHKQRKEAIDMHAKELDGIKGEIAEKTKTLDNSTTLDLRPGGVGSKEQTNRERITAELAQLHAKADLVTKSMTVAAKGFIPSPYLDGNTVQVAHVRTVVPEGAKPGDRTRAIDYRFDDHALFGNTGSTMVADAIMPNADKSSPAYKDLVSKTSGGWTIPVRNDITGQIDVIPGATNPAVSAPMLKKAEANGFKPFALQGIDYGQTYGVSDVPMARDMEEKFKVRHRSIGIGASAGRSVGRNGVLK